jgi:serine/threonine protein kinase
MSGRHEARSRVVQFVAAALSDGRRRIMAARSPSRYGKYEIVGRLATGGMADLFLARKSGPSGFETLAVVKRIRPHLAASPEFVRMFLDEARLAAQLRHPNVVSVYDAGQERGEYFFVMEYVHGRDLRAIIDAARARGRELTLDETLSIVAGVCAGLHHAHERTDAKGAPLGIVHRDISPSNVLVGFEGAVKLADFGIAKATQAATKEPGTNTLRGKLSYVSPEQVLGMPLDRRCDLYSLSVVLYELSTGGARPHDDAPTEFVAMKRTIESPIAPPSTRQAGYSEDLERIVMRGLERDPEKRWWTARELQLELETFGRRRQLALSPVTLARLMEELFPDELHAWHDAQSRGTALADHVTKSHTLSIDEPGDKTTRSYAGDAAPPTTETPAGAPRRDVRRLVVAATLVVAIVSSVAAVLVARHGSRPSAPAPTAVVAPPPESPQPQPPPPAPTETVAAPPASAMPATHRRPVHVAKKPARAPAAHWDPETAVLPH